MPKITTSGMEKLLILVASIPFILCQNHLIINTKSGPIKGFSSQNDIGNVYTFLKIPFAKPPVGDLRFKRPEPIEHWNNVLDGTQHPPSCPQPMGILDSFLPTLEVSEDCLFLNIYVPNDLLAASKKSVMVWFHGGGYGFGQANMYDASELALTGDVIVVTINYRLNIFGFLTTWDSSAVGNYGIWDQIMALQWIKHNIGDFGGNPESVTIFGQSAGAYSVSILSVLPQNRGLFHRVIAQSGTANSVYAFNNDKKSYINSAFEELKCDKADTNSVIECLRQVPSENFVNVTLKLLYAGFNDMYVSVAPRVDNDLINEPLVFSGDSSSSQKFFQSLDYMAGFTNGEGLLMAMSDEVMDLQQGFNVSEGISPESLCTRFIPRIAKRSYHSIPDVSEALCKLYRADDKIQQAKKAVDLIGDFTFASAAVQSLLAHSKQNKVSNTFQYIITRPTRVNFWAPLPEWFEGATHGTDLVYLFTIKNMLASINVTFSESDYKLKRTMMQYWTNFAKTGNPNSESLPDWPGFSGAKMEYMNLNLESKAESADSYMKQRMKLWLEDIPKIVEKQRTETANREEL